MITRISCAIFSLVLVLQIFIVRHLHAETFEEALALAYQHNPGLQAERAKLRATDEQVAEALSGWRPDIEATAEGGKAHQNIGGSDVTDRSGNVTPRDMSLNISQPIFRGFRTLAEVRSAKASVMAQRGALDDAEQKLFLDTGKAYLDVVEAQKILNIQKDEEGILKQKLEEIKDRLHIGELKKTDVAQAQARMKAALVSRLQAEGDLVNRQTTYARLTRKLPGELKQPVLKVKTPDDEDEFVNLAAQYNPAVIAANYGAAAAKSDVSANRGSLLPQVSLVGSLTDSVDQSTLAPPRENSASILARVSMPLYRTGADYAKTRAAQETAAQKSFELADIRNKVREDAANAWQAFSTASAARDAQKDVVTAAEDALEGVQTESHYGTRSTLDVLNAEQELLDDKINLVRAEHDEAFALLQLRASLGLLTAKAMHLPVDLYNPDEHYDRARTQWAGFSDGQ